MEKIVLAITVSKYFEIRLSEMGANGKGLREKVNSLASVLPHDAVSLLKEIALNRNAVLHGKGKHWEEDRFLVNALKAAALLPEQIGKPCQTVTVEPSVKVLQSPIVEKLSALKITPGPIPDDAIAALIEAKKPSLSDDQLEELIDRANDIAIFSNNCSCERWDSFLYLSKERCDNDAERLHNIALAPRWREACPARRTSQGDNLGPVSPRTLLTYRRNSLLSVDRVVKSSSR